MNDDQRQFRQSIVDAMPNDDVLREFLDLMEQKAIWVDDRGYIRLTLDAQRELDKERGKETYIQ